MGEIDVVNSVPGGLFSGVMEIACGYNHALALKSNGTVVAWGYNYHEQCSVPAGLNLAERLGSLSISAGSLTPAFSPDITAYSASVSWDTESLNITAVVEKVGNTLTINEQAAASGIPATVSLYTGVNNITVRVTSPDGLTRTYVLLVTRPALVLSAAASAAQTQPVAGAANTITLSVKRGVDIDTSFNGEKNVTVSGYLAAPNGACGSFNGTDLTGTSTTISLNFAQGVASAPLILNNAAAQNIVFSIGGVDNPQTAPLTITPKHAVASSIALTQVPFIIRESVPFDVTVEVFDFAGNRATGFEGIVIFQSSDPAAVLPGDYTFTEEDAGIKTFSITFNTPGSQTLTAAEPGAGGLIGYWKIDEGVGDQIRDASANGYHGSLYNSPVWSTDVPPGIKFTNPYALRFDGYDDLGRLPAGVSLADKSFSISIWAKSTKETAESYLVCSTNDQGANRSLHIGFRSPDTFTFAFKNNDLNAPAPSDKQWHHWVVTYSKETGKRTIYCDGEKVGEDTSATPFQGTSELSICRFFDTTAKKFGGNIDDLRIYERELSADEASYFADGNPGLVYGTFEINVSNGYIITYDANCGSGTLPQVIKKPGETFTVPSKDCFVPPENMSFKEWNTKADGSGTAYFPGETITVPNYDLTLYAIWEEFTWQGTGHINDPYIVSSAAHLNALRSKLGINVYFMQNTDIDLSAYINWEHFGTNYERPFVGHYDGGGYKIENLVIYRPGATLQSLFGLVSGNATIKNLNVVNANVTGGQNTAVIASTIADTQNFPGGGTIENCSAGGTVTGDDRVGGIVGNVAHANAVITGCVSTVNITSGNYAGGLAGRLNNGRISDCYATGSVNGAVAGGLVGIMENGTVERCYAAGAVSGTSAGGLIGNKTGGTVTASFYDTQTTNQSTSADGTAKSTANMKKRETFETAGWDFTDCWKIIDGCSYPRLAWETWSEEEQINLDIINDSAALYITYSPGDSADGVTGNLTLPKTGENGSTISWALTSGDEGLINTETGEVTRPADEDKTVTLTATISKEGGISVTKEFVLKLLRMESAFDYNLLLDVQAGEQSVTVTASVEKLNPAAQGGVLILALYYENRLIDIYVDKSLTGNTYQTAAELHHTGYEMSGDIRVVGVVWDCLENMKPIALYKRWYHNN